VNKLDSISFGKIVQIREHLIKLNLEGKKVYRLESGDPSFAVSPNILNAIKQALDEGKTHYIPNDGIPQLRKAIAEKLKNKNKILCNEKDIYITNGAMHALFVTFQCLLEDNDEVIVPEPLWTEIGENIRLAGGILNSVPLKREKNYQYTAEEISKKINPKTKAIFINSPHNPTGSVVSKNEISKIAELAAEKGLWLISDEAYEDLVFEGEHHSPASFLSNYSKTISIYSFSKSYAMSGLRTGYIVAKDKHFQARVQKLLRCTVNGINSATQWGALEAIQGDKSHLKMMLDEYKIRSEIIYNSISKINGLKPFKPQGAFYLWCEIDESLLKKLSLKNAAQLSDLLAENGIGSAPGETFGCSTAHAIRFAFSCETRMIEEGVKAISLLLNEKEV
jgi:aspartate aminotransferase